MTTSVILSSYNGEKYIEEQLLSIRDQTVPVGEVVIKDDCSTDSTVSIVKRFIADNNLLSWRLIVNDSNLGWKRNFMEGMKLVSGDCIFLCDQDDIWMPTKVEEMLSVFDDPDVGLLVSDLIPFADDGSDAYVFHPVLGKGLVSKVGCDVHICDSRRPGCTYCFRLELLGEIDKVWFEDWAHDFCLLTVAAAKGVLYSYNKPLIRFRRHAGTNTPSNEKTKLRRVELLEFNLRIIDIILSHAKDLDIPEENLKRLQEAQDFNQKRAESIRKGSVFGFAGLLPYLSCYPKPSSFIGDMIASMK